MAVGLYQNCRKKPFTTSNVNPTIGGPGLIRSGAVTGSRHTPALIHVAPISSQRAGITGGTINVQADLNGVTLDSANASTGSILQDTPLAFGYTSGHGLAGILTSDLIYSSGIVTARTLGTTPSIGAGLTQSVYGVISSTDGSASGLYVQIGSGAAAIEIRIYINGSLVSTTTGATTGTVYFISGITVAMFAMAELRIDVKNTGGGTIFGQNVYCNGSSSPGLRVGSGDVVYYAGFRTDDWDASDCLGSRYRTITATSAGGGSSFARWTIPNWTNYTTERTAVSVGTHHCEVDELCNTWID
jgi:hypothetical protein